MNNSIFTSRPPIDSILTLMTVRMIRGKVIKTAITVSYICSLRIGNSCNVRSSLFLDCVFHKG